jgi:hypothetical protein
MAAGKERLHKESKLPLGGSKSGLPAYLKVWVPDRKSYITY